MCFKANSKLRWNAKPFTPSGGHARTVSSRQSALPTAHRQHPALKEVQPQSYRLGDAKPLPSSVVVVQHEAVSAAGSAPASPRSDGSCRGSATTTPEKRRPSLDGREPRRSAFGGSSTDLGSVGGAAHTATPEALLQGLVAVAVHAHNGAKAAAAAAGAAAAAAAAAASPPVLAVEAAAEAESAAQPEARTELPLPLLEQSSCVAASVEAAAAAVDPELNAVEHPQLVMAANGELEQKAEEELVVTMVDAATQVEVEALSTPSLAVESEAAEVGSAGSAPVLTCGGASEAAAVAAPDVAQARPLAASVAVVGEGSSSGDGASVSSRPASPLPSTPSTSAGASTSTSTSTSTCGHPRRSAMEVTVSANSSVKDAAGGLVRVLERRGAALLVALKRNYSHPSQDDSTHVAVKTLAVSRFYVNTQQQGAVPGVAEEVSFIPFNRRVRGALDRSTFGFVVLKLPVDVLVNGSLGGALAGAATVLKAGASSSVDGLANALIRHLLEFGRVTVQMAGAAATHTALGALVCARSRLRRKFSSGLVALASFLTEDTSQRVGRTSVFLRLDVRRCVLEPATWLEGLVGVAGVRPEEQRMLLEA